MQMFMGIGIDLHGVRRTILTAFPLAIVGSGLAAWAPSYPWLLAAQVLIGMGCAPAFLVCTVFIARRFPTERFASLSGFAMGLGGLGMLFTGTPLASLVQASSWRMGFVVLGLAAMAAWAIMAWLVHDRPEPGAAGAESLGQAIRRFGDLLLLRHTWGIVALALVSYACFIALRGLWLGPLLVQRHGFSLLQSGHVATAVSVTALVGPLLFGRLDPGVLRRPWIVAFSLVLAVFYLLMAFLGSVWLDVAVPVLLGCLSGYVVWQYADVRAAYPKAITGRAMAVFTMAMFLGVAWVQWLTGALASWASSLGWDPYAAVLGGLALLMVAGAAAFAWLPQPPAQQPA